MAERLICRDLQECRSIYARALINSNAQYRRPAYGTLLTCVGVHLGSLSAAGLGAVERENIRSLPRHIYKSNCHLCNSSLCFEDVVVLSCKHLFHKASLPLMFALHD